MRKIAFTFGVGRTVGLFAMACVGLWLSPGAAHAGSTTLWYNGDDDGRDGLLNEVGSTNELIYDNFIVPTGDIYTITGVFSNDLMPNPAVATAYWEIREGVSAGNGGTFVASGDSADTVTATGRTGRVGNGTDNEYTNQVAVSVTLGAGTYWLAVAPDVAGGAYITTTSGANAVGFPPGNDGNSFSSSTSFGDNFTPTTNPTLEGPGTWDYSMGIIGTAALVAPVPEPSWAALLPTAGLILLGHRRRRRIGLRVNAANPQRTLATKPERWSERAASTRITTHYE